MCSKSNYPLGNPFYVSFFLISGGTKQADTVLAVQRMKVGIEVWCALEGWIWGFRQLPGPTELFSRL